MNGRGDRDRVVWYGVVATALTFVAFSLLQEELWGGFFFREVDRIAPALELAVAAFFLRGVVPAIAVMLRDGIARLVAVFFAAAVFVAVEPYAASIGAALFFSGTIVYRLFLRRAWTRGIEALYVARDTAYAGGFALLTGLVSSKPQYWCSYRPGTGYPPMGWERVTCEYLAPLPNEVAGANQLALALALVSIFLCGALLDAAARWSLRARAVDSLASRLVDAATAS